MRVFFIAFIRTNSFASELREIVEKSEFRFYSWKLRSYGALEVARFLFGPTPGVDSGGSYHDLFAEMFVDKS
jgi:hypothetical protein